MGYDVRIKCVYEVAKPEDGARVLVDQLWPKGKKREDLHLSQWHKGSAPSAVLRQSWHCGGLDSIAFAKAYREELKGDEKALLPLMRYARAGRLTLLTATRDPGTSHVPILRQAVLEGLVEEDFQADGQESASPTCYRQ